ncbi:hypothetical protein CNYM01_05930 [Colletotrichum nymphaeae SA-01]|uniref:Uncharacterized protein n=1 Tax=Colletotrichum nymphaeae SA-01 TaxID=1460502 RepID=A0A135UNF0_9PEZI|nr:hypothetical protein CNYM01_05930 [Colletotrichum nymphaeae SA-01]
MLKNRGEAAVKNGGNGTEDGINGATPHPKATLGWDHERWISAIPQGFRMEPHFTAPTGVENVKLGPREREANEHPPAPPADRNLPRTTPRRVRNLQTAKMSAFVPRFPITW